MDASKIAIKTSRGRYTKIITTSGKEFLLTRVLKEIETCLINLNHKTSITLVKNVKIQLATHRKQDFQKKISELVSKI